MPVVVGRIVAERPERERILVDVAGASDERGDKSPERA
jgi:hypothetical protein